MAIKVSNSGIRGQYHELTPARAARFAQAFATYTGGGDIMMASDTRPSSPFLNRAVVSGLTACGANIHDYGIIPTPILQHLIRRQGFQGGISVTANHNTFEWNSLIFLNREGAYFNQWEAEELFNIYHSSRFNFQPYNRIGIHIQEQKHLADYFTAMTIKNLKKRRKFVIDCANGFHQNIVDLLQDSLQVTFIPIFIGGGDWLWKDPEPSKKNAVFAAVMVKETKSNGGFLLNSDASRLLLVDEHGEILSEELTFPIFASILLEKEKKDLVTNYSTSKVIDQVARKFGVKVFRTDVGQPNVVQMVMEIKTSIGGEGNGSTVYTPFSYGFDSLFCIARIVAYLDEKDTSISRLAEEWKNPEIFKESIQLPPDKIYASLDRLEALYPIKKRLKDGFYVEDGGQWLCIRASSTVSIIRIVGEGRDIQAEISRLKELLV